MRWKLCSWRYSTTGAGFGSQSVYNLVIFTYMLTCILNKKKKKTTATNRDNTGELLHKCKYREHTAQFWSAAESKDADS